MTARSDGRADRPDLLQTFPLMPEIEAALADRFTVHRWFEIADRDAFLRDTGPRIRAVLTGGHIGLAPEIAAALPALEIVAVNGVGFDKVDLDQARSRGFRVTNTPDVLTDDVADFAIGLTIALARKIPAGERYIRDGKWAGGEMPLGRKVSGKRVGILGMGRIGRAIARRFEAFGCAIAYTGRKPQDLPYDYHPTAEALAADCEILVVAAAATPETFHAVNARVLGALGPRGMLVNIARGSLVDEAALIAALDEGRIAGAALDVFENEPEVPAVLLDRPDVVVAPHIGAATVETRLDIGRLVIANLDAHFAGKPLPTPVV